MFASMLGTGPKGIIGPRASRPKVVEGSSRFTSGGDLYAYLTSFGLDPGSRAGSQERLCHAGLHP
jgi:hypothetical protein